MPDVYVIFRDRLPFGAKLNGEQWEISYSTGSKSGNVSIFARSVSGRKVYTLWSGREAEMNGALECGIRVAGATPERGLVTALRREGKAILMQEKLPPRKVYG